MPEPVRPERGDDGLDFLLAQLLIVLAVVVVTGPALVVAAPLAFAIDARGWRRWPALTGGAALCAGAVALGAWEAYWETWEHVWQAVRFHRLFRPADLLGLVPLGLTAGVGLGPILQIAVRHRNEHETTRHHREVSEARRARVQVERAIGRPMPAPPDRTVLGLRLDGSIKGWVVRHRLRAVVAPPAEVWGRQTLILGETGSGKTVTGLGIAAELLRVGWDVYWIDGKADPDTRASFLAAATSAGVDPRDGSVEPINGWRGGAEAVVNRLLATQHFSDEYYEGVARSVLRMAVGEKAIVSLGDLVDRIDKKLLARTVSGDPRSADLLRLIPDRELFGVKARYDGIAWAVGDLLDGTWSYEDTRSAYVPVGRPENRHQAAEVGAFLLEDLLHWAMARKPRHRRAVVIVDEFSKLSERPDAAVDLVERARVSGVGVVLIGQTWASLGSDDTIRNRLAGTVGTVIVHQLKQPDEAAALAGTKWVMERTEQTLVLGHTGLGSQRAGNQYVVHPDEIRTLRRGEAFAIHRGQAIRGRMRSPDGLHTP